MKNEDYILPCSLDEKFSFFIQSEATILHSSFKRSAHSSFFILHSSFNCFHFSLIIKDYE
jgi:hypothetical protein